jgi:hypothetical protein
MCEICKAIEKLHLEESTEARELFECMCFRRTETESALRAFVRDKGQGGSPAFVSGPLRSLVVPQCSVA